MKYLDANFFVFALLDNTKLGENARALQQEIIEGKHSTVTSSLTLDEILWVLVRNNRRELIEEVIDDIYHMPNLTIVATSAAAPKTAVKYIQKYNLKPRDAIHLAVMEELKIKEIISDDVNFDGVRGVKRIGID
ncbi:MAG: type II toxin-antitoxin system VapC family toxin [Candidatus Hydrothermarchaeota archaeon]|nr:type II toxin-antitoxin system VapC family toxin [Candidatus Hydrothermarchaeota archaeon]